MRVVRVWRPPATGPVANHCCLLCGAGDPLPLPCAQYDSRLKSVCLREA